MTDLARVTVLGSGTSHGVPLIGCECATCSSKDPRDQRMRPSIYIELSGGKNILQKSKAQYPKLSKEYIIKQSPEIIIEAGPKSNLSQKEIDYRVKQWNRFPTIQAVRDKRIYFIGADYILIPGPRLVKILENFVQVIHPGLSKSQTEKISFQETVKP